MWTFLPPSLDVAVRDRLIMNMKRKLQPLNSPACSLITITIIIMITGDVGVTTLKLSVIGVCLMGDPVGIDRAHDCPILTVETEHLSNIMDKDKITATLEVQN